MSLTNNYEYIQVKIQDQILSLTLNRPLKKNALNQKMIQEINSVLDKNKASEKIRVILISSNSDVFCAGAEVICRDGCKRGAFIPTSQSPNFSRSRFVKFQEF